MNNEEQRQALRKGRPSKQALDDRGPGYWGEVHGEIVWISTFPYKGPAAYTKNPVRCKSSRSRSWRSHL